MNWLRKNKEIVLQILAFSIIGTVMHKLWMIYFAIALIIILPFEKIRNAYISFLVKTINYIGIIIKTILFTILFALVFIPISFILKTKKEEDSFGYITINQALNEQSFLKMW